jgi:hypothetical protein
MSRLSRSLLLVLVTVGAILLILVLTPVGTYVAASVARLVGLFGNPANLPPDTYNAHLVVQLAQRLQFDDIQQVAICLDNYSTIVVLRPPADKADIQRLLNAVKCIRVDNDLARTEGRDVLIVDAHGDGGVNVYGVFDPARAPIISPSMRSNDLSRIVQDIVRRKGKPFRINRQ